MSKLGKIFLILSLLFLLVFLLIGFLSPFITSKHYIPLYASFALLLTAVLIDLKFYKNFFFLKTTKRGLSIGASIILFLLLMVAINFIAFKNNIDWDLTTEKLHSLSEQTLDVLKVLEEPLEVKVFLIAGRQDQNSIREMFDTKIRLYKLAGNVNVTYINPLVEPVLAKEYNVDESGAIVFEYRGKKTELDVASNYTAFGGGINFTEQDITNAIIKITREKDKKLYFLTNHGEVDIFSDKVDGARTLKESLEALSYQIENLSFIQAEGKVPDDADAVLILGPTQPLLQSEVQALIDYLKQGGNLLLAIDPGTRHGTDELLRTLGLKFKNEYVVDRMSALLGDVPVTALGIRYSMESDVTKKLTPGAATLFYLTSGFDQIETEHSFEYDELVKTDQTTVATSELEREINVSSRGPFSLVYEVRGAFEKPAEGEEVSEDSKFFALVYGDSNIFTNARIFQQLNRDLVLNSVSALLRDKDLLNLRPKTPSQTMMTNFSRTRYRLFNVIPFLVFPLALIITGIILSYRRKGL